MPSKRSSVIVFILMELNVIFFSIAGAERATSRPWCLIGATWCHFYYTRMVSATVSDKFIHRNISKHVLTRI